MLAAGKSSYCSGIPVAFPTVQGNSFGKTSAVDMDDTETVINCYKQGYKRKWRHCCTVMGFTKRRDLSDLGVICHHADQDTKNIAKSNCCYCCQDSHMLFLYIFLREKMFLQTLLQKFSSSSSWSLQKLKKSGGKKFNECTYKYDSMLIEWIIKTKKHPMRTSWVHFHIFHAHQSIPLIAYIKMCRSELLETGNRTKMSRATSAFLYIYAISAVIIFYWDSKELDKACQLFV